MIMKRSTTLQSWKSPLWSLIFFSWPLSSLIVSHSLTVLLLFPQKRRSPQRTPALCISLNRLILRYFSSPFDHPYADISIFFILFINPSVMWPLPNKPAPPHDHLCLCLTRLYFSISFSISLSMFRGVAVEGISPKLGRSHILIKKVPLLLALKQ